MAAARSVADALARVTGDIAGAPPASTHARVHVSVEVVAATGFEAGPLCACAGRARAGVWQR